MHIMIIGGGKVGETLISHLSEEGNDITLIDRSMHIVENLMGSYDIIGFQGNGTNYQTLENANVHTADMFLSVTPSDEINIISALMAKQMGAKFTIARVRNPEYSEHLEFMIEKMGIDLVINPDQAAAFDIERILKFPHALDVETFAAGRVNLVELLVEENSLIDGMALNKLFGIGISVLVCIVKRGEEVYIPRGDFILQAGDQIYVTGTSNDLYRFSVSLGHNKEVIENIMIIGGGRITHYLTKRLLRAGKKLKIIENNLERCEELAMAYPQVIVVHGDGTNQELLEAEGISHYDATVALTGIDEENILISMYAASLHTPRTITKINRTSLLKILKNVGLQTIVTPKNLMANLIVRAVRANQNAQGSMILTLYKLVQNQVEAIEFMIKEDPDITGIPLKNLSLSKDALIVYILRNREFLFPHGNSILLPGDRTIVVTTKTGINDIKELLV